MKITEEQTDKATGKEAIEKVIKTDKDPKTSEAVGHLEKVDEAYEAKSSGKPHPDHTKQAKADEKDADSTKEEWKKELDDFKKAGSKTPDAVADAEKQAHDKKHEDKEKKVNKDMKETEKKASTEFKKQKDDAKKETEEKEKKEKEGHVPTPEEEKKEKIVKALTADDTKDKVA